MSTDLYGVRVIDTKPDENKVRLKVFVVYYDVAYKSHQPIPADPSFFLRILWDEGDARFGGGGSIGHEISVEQILDESWVNKNTFKFIDTVEILSITNFPVEDYSSFYDFYYERDGVWQDEDKLVQAVYDIHVTDKKYIDHLENGMSWGTTSYETKAIQISLLHVKTLPDISSLIVRLYPFKGKEKEEANICTALFSKDNSKLFILSEAGELVTYNAQNWTEEWRNDTGKCFGTIQCDNIKRLVWVDDNTVLNFEGEKTNQNILPNFEANYKGADIYRSPSSNYFLFFYSNKIAIYNINGNLLWTHESSNTDYCLQTAFFANEELIIVRDEFSGIFKIFELNTGAEIKSFKIDGIITNMNLDPTGNLLSTNNLRANSTRIFDLKSTKLIFEFSTKDQNDDFLSACIWSPNHKFVAITTEEEQGMRRNSQNGGYLSIYPIGIEEI